MEKKDLLARRKALNEQRAMVLIGQTITQPSVSIDEGLCLMLDDLTEGNFERLTQLFYQVKMTIERKVIARRK